MGSNETLVIPAFIAGIQDPAGCGACGALAPGETHRDDTGKTWLFPPILRQPGGWAVKGFMPGLAPGGSGVRATFNAIAISA